MGILTLNFLTKHTHQMFGVICVKNSKWSVNFSCTLNIDSDHYCILKCNVPSKSRRNDVDFTKVPTHQMLVISESIVPFGVIELNIDRSSNFRSYHIQSKNSHQPICQCLEWHNTSRISHWIFHWKIDSSHSNRINLNVIKSCFHSYENSALYSLHFDERIKCSLAKHLRTQLASI